MTELIGQAMWFVLFLLILGGSQDPKVGFIANKDDRCFVFANYLSPVVKHL
jgi:hypothetical protein